MSIFHRKAPTHHTTVKEHTPIYDLDAYLTQRKQKQRIKRYTDTIIFLIIIIGCTLGISNFDLTYIGA